MAQVSSQHKILRLRSVLARTGLSRSMAYMLLRDGLFPKPISLGLRAVGWLESEVDGWIAHRVQESRKGKAEAKR